MRAQSMTPPPIRPPRSSPSGAALRSFAATLTVTLLPMLGLGATSCSSSPSQRPLDAASTEVATPDGGVAERTAVTDAVGDGGSATVGSFIVELVSATATDPARTSLQGVVSDGPTPSAIVWDPVDTAGGCTLSKPRAPFCSPACAGGAVCVEDGQCAGQPTTQDLGPIEVTGLGASAFTVTPILNAYQLPVDLTLPFPPAAEGADVGIGVTSGPYGSFTLHARAVAPLSSDGVLTIQRNAAATVNWQAPGQPEVARVQIKLDISHHGGSTGMIACDVPDTGTVDIGASLITELIDLGVAGYPRISLSRVSTGAAAIAPGIVTLQVSSTVVRDVVIPGYTSCNTSADCLAGKTCLPTSLCQQ
jgi:hypothetical protein